MSLNFVQLNIFHLPKMAGYVTIQPFLEDGTCSTEQSSNSFLRNGHFSYSLNVVFFRKCWCICHNIPTFYIPELWNLNFVDFTVALVTQALPSCPYHPLNCQNLEHRQFPSKFQSPKFKISNSGKRKVHMFEEMTNASVLWEKSYLYKKPLKVTSDSKLILNDSRGSLKLV